jgi:hypothetical protein
MRFTDGEWHLGSIIAMPGTRRTNKKYLVEFWDNDKQRTNGPGDPDLKFSSYSKYSYSKFLEKKRKGRQCRRRSRTRRWWQRVNAEKYVGVDTFAQGAHGLQMRI